MKTLVGTSAAVAATAVAGGLASGSRSSWYDGLRKPPFQPPPIAFPLIWPALYAAIAWSSAKVIDEATDTERTAFEIALGTNLVLNAGWTWTFFRAHRPWLATAHSAVLTASTADLARRARQVSPAAHTALAPYLAWTGFATVLSGSIAWLNRRRAA